MPVTQLPDDMLQLTSQFAGFSNHLGNASRGLRESTEADKRANCHRQSPACAGNLVLMQMGNECFGFCKEHRGYVFVRLINMICSGLWIEMDDMKNASHSPLEQNGSHSPLDKLEIWVEDTLIWVITPTGANFGFQVWEPLEHRKDTTSNPGKHLLQHEATLYSTQTTMVATYSVMPEGAISHIRGFWNAEPIRFQQIKQSQFTVELNPNMFQDEVFAKRAFAPSHKLSLLFELQG